MCFHVHVDISEGYFQESVLPFQQVGPRIEPDGHEELGGTQVLYKADGQGEGLGTSKMAAFFLILLTLDKNLAT